MSFRKRNWMVTQTEDTSVLEHLDDHVLEPESAALW